MQVGAGICEGQKDAGLVSDRSKRHNHDDAKVDGLLAVPRYAELVNNFDDDTEDGVERAPSVLVVSWSGWRREMAKWVQKEKEKDDKDDEELASVVYGRRWSKWLPRSLELLFAGRAETDVNKQLERTRRQNAHTEEACLMELLVDEVEGEQYPDDGELEGSGDDFDG